jgi:cytochrome bd ubiquinol oxidase subunit II
METMEILQTVWFALWGVLWAVYFMLDGFDLGLGTLMPFLAKDDRDRRVIYNAQGPFWDGNEVWLVTAGGVTFAAFPTTYATMFSVAYTPMLLLLFALILRGISFEFRGKEAWGWWRRTWDGCMHVGSFAAALLLGVTFANIFAGLPFDSDGVFHGNLLTFLNPYGLLGGALFVLLFAVHGSLWLAIKAEGELAGRGARMAARLWPVLVVVTTAFGAYSWFHTSLWDNHLSKPYLLIFPLLAVAGLVANRVFQARRQFWKAWGASCVTIFSATLWGIAGLFPVMFPSTLDPAASMTAHNASSSQLTLTIMLGVAGTCIPTVIAYQTWVYVTFRGKVTDEVLAEDEAY